MNKTPPTQSKIERMQNWTKKKKRKLRYTQSTEEMHARDFIVR